MFGDGILVVLGVAAGIDIAIIRGRVTVFPVAPTSRHP